MYINLSLPSSNFLLEQRARHGGPSSNSSFVPTKIFLYVWSTNLSSSCLPILLCSAACKNLSRFNLLLSLSTAYLLVLPLLKSKRTYLDIGACVGKASKAFVDVFDNVVVFEPNPESLSVLKEIDGIKIKEVAVSDYIGTTEFIVPN